MPNPGLRLKEPAIAGYVYNPPQTPPFEKEGLVVSLWLTSPKVRNILSVTTSFCTISTALYAKINRSKIGGICKKKRCYANLEAPLKRWLHTNHCYNFL